MTLQGLKYWHVEQARDLLRKSGEQLALYAAGRDPKGLERAKFALSLVVFHVDAATLLDLTIVGG